MKSNLNGRLRKLLYFIKFCINQIDKCGHIQNYIKLNLTNDSIIGEEYVVKKNDDFDLFFSFSWSLGFYQQQPVMDFGEVNEEREIEVGYLQLNTNY